MPNNHAFEKKTKCTTEFSFSRNCKSVKTIEPAKFRVFLSGGIHFKIVKDFV